MNAIFRRNQSKLHHVQRSVKANVPLDAFYKTWHMPGRMDEGYHAADVITEILGGGGSSRLFQSLGKRKKIVQQY